VQVVANYSLMLAVEIDLKAECERVSREIARVDTEISKAQSKLSNSAFVDRAPAEVVGQERARLAQFVSTRSLLAAQAEKLGCS
jgi:valyl-tRNA synthetase